MIPVTADTTYPGFLGIYIATGMNLDYVEYLPTGTIYIANRRFSYYDDRFYNI